MNDVSKTPSQDPQGSAEDRNDPALAPQTPGESGAQAQVTTAEPESADQAVDQKNLHTDNDNEFSPGFKPNPDRPAPSEETDADIDTDGG